MNSSLRYVFGSLVSGDFDSGSDVDVLVVSDDEHVSCPQNWSVYTKSGIRRLYEKGTLFAWHLYQDSVPVGSETRKYDFLREIGPPASYDSAPSEISELKNIVVSSLSELLDNTPSSVFEVGLIAVAVRDIAMAASIFINGKFNFSKFAPFELSQLSLDIPRPLYLTMLNCRRSTVRGETLSDNENPANELLKHRKSIIRWIDEVATKIAGTI
ncbi:nucleotidyltransferase domain-containing protein [Alteromonas gilva]|uniref:Nucleotidyltransferase domain-containing protein n=1 Tax=Alteromonas gilva TaxID=2987522 RepID=A0ABT5KZV2_9ALTE|nr:nucleotidyltransferase domain-containing protein [Alteromonas gilva]MDC8829719.1 nucleotidyltransferase domain-containing protein [Alteromonas gilva]